MTPRVSSPPVNNRDMASKYASASPLVNNITPESSIERSPHKLKDYGVPVTDKTKLKFAALINNRRNDGKFAKDASLQILRL
jgi:hypothetical protein